MNRKLEVLSDSSTSEDEDLPKLPSKKLKTGLETDSALCFPTEVCPRDVPRETESNEKMPQLQQKNNKVDKDKPTKKEIKEMKKIKLDQEKQLAKNIKQVLKNTNKEECIKNIIVIINSSILDQVYGNAIKNILKENKISMKSTETFTNVITWNRKLQSIKDMCIKESEATEKHALLMMSAKKFSDLVNDKKLIDHVKEIILDIKCEHITIAVYGIHKPTEKQEQAILELEMHIKCHLQFFKAVEPLASFVLMVTKSVALIPYKKSNEEKYKSQNLYLNEFKKDTVRVDLNGNGLGRLWHQMLTMIPLARLETAEAITAAYPTPSALFKSYESCSEKESMLQYIDIRRAHGPLTANRRIGPEMSRKICNFFTATVNKTL